MPEEEAFTVLVRIMQEYRFFNFLIDLIMIMLIIIIPYYHDASANNAGVQVLFMTMSS